MARTTIAPETPLTPSSRPPPVFASVDWAEPIDLDAYIRNTPSHATIRGYFFTALLAEAAQKSVTSLAARDRYISFNEYPVRDFVVLLADVASRMFPTVAPRQALRLAGRGAFAAIANSLIGRIAFDGSAKPLFETLRELEKAYTLAMPQSAVIARELRADTIEVSLERIYTFVDAHHVGVIEGFLFERGYRSEIVVAPMTLSAAKMRGVLRPR